MSTKISSIPQLIKLLNNTSKEEYKSQNIILDIPPDEFLPYEHWSSDTYTRNCIVREEDYELILLCWEPAQSTEIHCHGGQECWVYLVDGLIEESHYQYQNDQLIFKNKESLSSGDISYMADNMGYHSLENNASSRTMSLHLYMNPIDDCTVYDDTTHSFVPKSLEYDFYNKNVLTE